MPALRIFLTASEPPAFLTAGRRGCASGGRGCRGRGGLGSPRAEVGEKPRCGAGERPRVDFSTRRAAAEEGREGCRDSPRRAVERGAGEGEREPRSCFTGGTWPTSMPETTPAAQNASARARQSPQRGPRGRRRSRARGRASPHSYRAWPAPARCACSKE